MSPTLSNCGHLVLTGTLVDTQAEFGAGMRICEEAIIVVDTDTGVIVDKIEKELHDNHALNGLNGDQNGVNDGQNGVKNGTGNGTNGEHGVNGFFDLEQRLEHVIHKYDATSVIRMGPNEFLLPGFIDCHTHAPQFPNAGLGLDLPLLEWLAKYTFPLESQFSEPKFAQQVFERLVSSSLNLGSTTVAYFTSIHLDATLALCDTINALGQRAVVGKCCMDRNPSSSYVESTASSLAATKLFLESLAKKHYALIEPCVMPRFVPACSPSLLSGLGRLASKKEPKLRITSHISENVEEVELVRDLEPECKSYAEVYDKHKLLTPRTFLAHGVHLTDDELKLLAQRGTGIAHCPNSNNSIRSGNFNAKRAIAFGLKVGLATDCSAGYSISMINAMQHCLSTSNLLGPEWTLGVAEALYLATRGSAQVLDLDDQIGSFDVGKSFDAIRIDMRKQPLTAPLGFESAEQLVEKFVRLADDRNVVHVFVNGKTVKKGQISKF